MGRITKIDSINEEKVKVTLELNEKELLWLRGNLDKMYVFSENNLDLTTRLVQRGKRDSTKYLLMPKEFRQNVMPSNNVKCNFIDSKTKKIFLFMVNKF